MWYRGLRTGGEVYNCIGEKLNVALILQFVKFKTHHDSIINYTFCCEFGFLAVKIVSSLKIDPEMYFVNAAFIA